MNLADFMLSDVSGSTEYVVRSGTARMSDSSICAYPATELPSKTTPSLNALSNLFRGTVSVLTTPRISVNCICRNLISSAFMRLRVSLVRSSMKSNVMI